MKNINRFSIYIYMSSNSRKRNREESPAKKSLSPEELKSVTKTDIEDLEKKYIKYINESFDFLRDTSKLKTKRDRDERETEIADKIKYTNTKLLSKHPELEKNTKFMAMIKGANTGTFGGKVKKTYKSNKKYRKRRTVKRKFT